MYLNITLIILLIVTLAWREIQILIDRGSYTGTSRIPIWYTDWRSKWKNWDSFHVSNGLATLIIMVLFYNNGSLPEIIYLWQSWLTAAVHICFYWLIWMQIRNLGMRINYKEE